MNGLKRNNFMPTIKVSSACYNEIATALEKQGLKLGTNVKGLTLTEDTTIVDPVDWRAATVRKDCIVAAANANTHPGKQDIIILAEKMFQYVLTGKVVNDE